MSLPTKPSRLDFEHITAHQVSRILANGGDLSSLTDAERAYFDMMEVVRGLHARSRFPGTDRLVTKAGIIKLLKSDVYGLSDWMARRVYADALNFFYADEGVSAQAWANYYAGQIDKLISMAITSGKTDQARALIKEAATLRGCFNEQESQIPQELLDVSPMVIYTSDATDIGAPKADRAEIDKWLDSLPEIPQIHRDRVREDAGIKQRELLNRLKRDVEEFSPQDNR